MNQAVIEMGTVFILLFNLMKNKSVELHLASFHLYVLIQAVYLCKGKNNMEIIRKSCAQQGNSKTTI